MGAMSLVVIYFNMVDYISRRRSGEGRVSFSRSNCFYLPSRWIQKEEGGGITLERGWGGCTYPPPTFLQLGHV
jgi:hypothetical protein